jgi:hypothetical protein
MEKRLIELTGGTKREQENIKRRQNIEERKRDKIKSIRNKDQIEFII